MKLTLKQAFDLSIEKWEGIVKDGKTPESILVLELLANCGLCEYQRLLIPPDLRNLCAGCPLNIYPIELKLGCIHEKHPYYIWKHNRTKENAQAVLDLIKSKHE